MATPSPSNGFGWKHVTPIFGVGMIIFNCWLLYRDTVAKESVNGQDLILHLSIFGLGIALIFSNRDDFQQLLQMVLAAIPWKRS